MNKFHLDSTSGKNLTPKRLEQDTPPKKNSENQSAQKVSFQEVLKNAVNKTEDAPKIRQDIVNKYKMSLANGTYEVKAQELAEKIIQKIREDKARKII